MLAYHVAGTIALGIAAIFLYLALRELLASRTTAFAIALVFALLPHYSTDRVWFASHQATLCMLFAFAGVFALLRLVRIDARHSKAWAAVAVVSFGLSILSYEVAFGMIAASLLVAAYLAYRNERVSLKRILVGFAGIGALLAGIVLAKERADENCISPSFLRALLGACWARNCAGSSVQCVDVWPAHSWRFPPACIGTRR